MRWIGLVLAGLGCMPGAVDAEVRDGDAFGEVIDVRVLNLEVAVTDSEGHFVPGLGPEDFRLTVDGQEVSIDYFSEIRDGLARPVGGSAEQGSGRVAAVPSVTPGEVVGTNFLLFIDNYFGIARDREVVIEKMVEQAREFGPRDRMAIVAFDGRELDLVADWTSSPDVLAERLVLAMEQPTYGLHRLGEDGRFQLQLQSLGSGLISSSVEHLIAERVRVLSGQVNTVVSAATTALRSMVPDSGRRVMLLMSGGWPADPATYVAGFNADIIHRTAIYAPKQAFTDLASTANLLGYTLYPIDMPGRQVQSRAVASDRGERFAIFSPPSTTPGGPQSKGQALAPQISASERSAEQFQAEIDAFDTSSGREHEVERSLLTLARETGGQAMTNGLREAVMTTALEDSGSYYWLGYSPTWQRDDVSHPVRVEVLRPGLESRSRRSFRDLSRSAEVTMLVESHLLFSTDRLFSTDLGGSTLQVETGTPKVFARRVQLPLSLRIPMDDVVMLPVAGGYEAQLELRIAVKDDRGDRSEIPVIPIVFGGREPPAPGDHATYETTVKLRKKRQRLALALYDQVGEKILSTSIDFDPEAR